MLIYSVCYCKPPQMENVSQDGREGIIDVTQTFLGKTRPKKKMNKNSENKN